MAQAPAIPDRRERRRLELRSRIVETAKALFEEQGYDATAVAQICERADIAYGTFFNHFRTKLDLLREVGESAMLGVFEGLETLSKQSGCFADHLILLFEATAEHAEQLGPGMRELMGKMITLVYQESAEDADRRIHVAFRGFLERGVTNGDFRDDFDLDTMTEVVMGTFNTVMLSWVHFDDYPLRARAASAARLLASSLRAPGRRSA